MLHVAQYASPHPPPSSPPHYDVTLKEEAMECQTWGSQRLNSQVLSP